VKKENIVFFIEAAKEYVWRQFEGGPAIQFCFLANLLLRAGAAKAKHLKV
jgi:hypothetical protein